MTALGLAEDLKKGLIDRFRSLPMSRATVLAGRTLSDVATNIVSLAIMIGVGCWWGRAEAAQAIGFMLIFPLTFASFSSVPVESMPDGLRQFAEVNPFTQATDAIRALWVGTPAGDSVWLTVVWSVGLIAVFSALSTARYRKTVNK